MAFVSDAPQPDGPKPQKAKSLHLQQRKSVAINKPTICPACGPYIYGFHTCFAPPTWMCVRAYVALGYLYEYEHGTLVGIAAVYGSSPFAPSPPSPHTLPPLYPCPSRSVDPYDQKALFFSAARNARSGSLAARKPSGEDAPTHGVSTTSFCVCVFFFRSLQMYHL